MAQASMHLDLNRACDRSCDFCPVRAADKLGPSPRAQAALAGLQRALAQQVRTLTLTGGEPTLEPWLPQLLRRAAAGGIPERVLETHAGSITPARAQQLAQAGLTRAVVAINCLDPQVSDQLTGTPGDLQASLQGMVGLLRAGVDVEVTAALLPETAPLLADLRAGLPALASGLPGRLLRLVVRPIGQSPRPRPLLSPGDAAAALSAAACAASPLPLQQASGHELPACVFADPAAALPLLSLSRQRAEREAGRHVRIAACAVCSVREVCPGVRPALAPRLPADQPPAPDHLLAMVQDVDSVVGGADQPLPTTPDAVAILWPGLCRSLGLVASTPLPAAVANAIAHQQAPAGPLWPIESSAFDREALELEAGLRQLLRREVPDPNRVDQAVATLRRRGFAVAQLTSEVAGVGGLPRHHVFAARDPAVLQAATALDRDLGGSHLQKAKAIRQFGLWFGYPPCCVEAFLRGAALDDAVLVADRAQRQADQQLPWVQNWVVVPLRLGSWLPCAPDCARSLEQMRAVASLLQQAAPGWLRSVRPLLQAPALALGFDRVVMLPGAVRGTGQPGQTVWHYQQVVDLGQLDGHVAPMPRPLWLAFGWLVTDALRRGTTLVRDGNLLRIVDNEREVTRLQFAVAAPRVLDFTGDMDWSSRPASRPSTRGQL